MMSWLSERPPENCRVRWPRIQTYFRCGCVVWAVLASCAGSAQVAPDSLAAVHVERCMAAYRKGNLAVAILELRLALREEPKNAQLQFMLGNALYRSGDMRDAADAYKDSLELRPDLETHMSRGFALFELKEFRQASDEWQAAVRLNRAEPFAHAGFAVGL